MKASWDNKLWWKKNVILFYLDNINATSLKVIIGRSYMIKDILQRISEQNQTYCRYTIEIYIVYMYLKKDIFQRRREKVSWWSQKSSTNATRPSHVHRVTLQKWEYTLYIIQGAPSKVKVWKTGIIRPSHVHRVTRNKYMSSYPVEIDIYQVTL